MVIVLNGDGFIVVILHLKVKSAFHVFLCEEILQSIPSVFDILWKFYSSLSSFLT